MLEFFINNILKITVLLVATGIFVYLLRKMYREQRLNQFLRLRQKTLRRFRFSSRRSRIIGLSSLVLLPIMFIIVFVGMTRLPRLDFEEHIRHIDNVEHLVEIHQRYHPNYTAINFGSAPSDGDRIHETSIDDTYLFRNQNMSNVFNTMFVHQGNLYTLFEGHLSIIDFSNVSEPKEKGSLLFAESFSALGFFVKEDVIVVVGKNTDHYNCLPYRLACLNYDFGDFVEIYVYDAEDYTQLDHISIPGYTTDVRLIDKALVLVVNQPLPYDGEGRLDSNQLVNHMPSITHNGDVSYNFFREIKYIEGTRPNTFTSIIHFNLETRETVHKTLLTEDNYHLYINENSIYIFNNSYIFKDIADHFITPDPIDYTNTAITKYNFNDEELNYVRTRIIEGEVFSHQAIEVLEDIILVTIDKDNVLKAVRLSRNLDLYEIYDLPLQHGVISASVQQQHIYLDTDDKSSNAYRVQLLPELAQVSYQIISQSELPMLHSISRENYLMGLALKPLFSMRIYHTNDLTDGIKYSWPLKNIEQDHGGNEQRFDITRIFNDDISDRVIIPIYSLEYDMLVFVEFDGISFPSVVYRIVESHHAYFRLGSIYYNDHYIIRDSESIRIYHKDNLDSPVYQKNN